MTETRFDRFKTAYLEMAKIAAYRPQAPSDGCGHIRLSRKELEDPVRLENEAAAYALAFVKADDERRHDVGCSNFTQNRALVYIIEAARAACSANPDLLITLCQMAVDEVKKEEGR